MYLIKTYSVDIYIATDSYDIPFPLVDSKYTGMFRTLVTMYGAYFYFAHNAIHDIPRTYVKFHMTTPIKEFWYSTILYCRKKALAKTRPTLLVKSAVLRISNEFLIRKSYFNIWSLVLPTGYDNSVPEEVTKTTPSGDRTT